MWPDSLVLPLDCNSRQQSGSRDCGGLEAALAEAVAEAVAETVAQEQSRGGAIALIAHHGTLT